MHHSLNSWCLHWIINMARNTEWGKLLPEVATMSVSSGQFIPQAEYLSWRLIVCCKIVFHTSILAKFPVVRVLNCRHSTVELFNPHSHAHILHLEYLPSYQNILSLHKRGVQTNRNNKINVLKLTLKLLFSCWETMYLAMSMETIYPGPLAYGG